MSATSVMSLLPAGVGELCCTVGRCCLANTSSCFWSRCLICNRSGCWKPRSVRCAMLSVYIMSDVHVLHGVHTISAIVTMYITLERTIWWLQQTHLDWITLYCYTGGMFQMYMLFQLHAHRKQTTVLRHSLMSAQYKFFSSRVEIPQLI
jgi:branched-subunit amino acid transport protein AzlD